MQVSGARLALIVVFLVGLVAYGPHIYYLASVASENTLFKMRPSAEKALAYGGRHLNASSRALYDIDRTEMWFRTAERMEAELPLLNHQLARVTFLRGNLGEALFYIEKEIQLGNHKSNAHYMRGLIQGYLGNYTEAAKSYEKYLVDNPQNWAGLTDYAWVLLKAKRFEDARDATERGLMVFPDNAWLLNTSAIALYELGDLSLALERAQKAVAATEKLTESDWLHAYPGNDPAIAHEGLATLRKSAVDNMHIVEAAHASSTI
jgi:tetratricopeptide (TPR) repeat protein